MFARKATSISSFMASRVLQLQPTTAAGRFMRAMSAAAANLELNIRFHGKTALVTGATKGIGRQTALTLAANGARVLAVGRSGLDSLVQENPNIVPVQLDLSNVAGIEAALADVGDIDLLVNNAGITALAPFESFSVEDFEKVMRVNVTAAMVVGQVAAKSMLARGVGGSIVNVSSQASTVGLPEHTAYCASKGALDQLTRTMAVELGPHKIRVNSVNPTVVLTEMGKQAWSDKAKAEPMLARIPLRRFAEEQDVVDVICFLLSDKASMVNGAFVPVDGGFWAA